MNCAVDGCGNSGRLTRGWCIRHYNRWYYTGSPTTRDRRFRPITAEATYTAIHQRVNTLWGSASQYPCILCPAQAREWAYDNSDPDQRYGPTKNGKPVDSWSYFSLWPEFYAPMCCKCHRSMDKRVAANELREYREWKIRHPGTVLPETEPILRLVECG